MAEKENESNRLFEDEKVIEIEIERLRSFKDHPFKVTDDKEMHLLKDSIKQYGVLNPLSYCSALSVSFLLRSEIGRASCRERV